MSPLSYGRLYFLEFSGNGGDFGQSSGNGGIVAFSRILSDREVLIMANTNASAGFSWSVIVDRDLNATPRRTRGAFSNLGTSGAGTVQQIAAARFFQPSGMTTTAAAALPVF